jgi:O-antigen ligase
MPHPQSSTPALLQARPIIRKQPSKPENNLHPEMTTFGHQIEKSLTSAAHFWKTHPFLKASRYFLAVFLLTFPFQIRALLYSAPVYQSGGFDYFSSFFLYFSDLCFFFAFLCWAVSLWKKETEFHFHLGDEMLTFIILALLLIMTGNAFFVAAPELHFFIMFRFVELVLLYLMVVNRVLRQREIVLLLLFGLCFQAFVALYQYLLQGSVGLTFLGEAQVNTATLGVAKIDIGSQKILRSFGTFPHANVLGGLLFMGIVYAVALLKKYRWFVLGVLWLLSMGLLFSFSRSAFFALIAAFLLYISVQNSKIVIRYVLLAVSIFLFFIVVFNLENIVLNRFLFEDTASTQERTLYLKIGKDMFLQQPLGVGLGAFTLNMQDYTSTKLTPWLFQPVHNIFLLMTNELGIVGGLLFLTLFCYCFYQLLALTRKQKTPENRSAVALLLAMLVGIAVIGFFDHYFVTIYQAQVMLFIYFGFVSSLLSSVRLPMRNS